MIWEEKLFVVSSLFTLSIEVDSKHQVSHLISRLALLWVLSDLMNGVNSDYDSEVQYNSTEQLGVLETDFPVMWLATRYFVTTTHKRCMNGWQ